MKQLIIPIIAFIIGFVGFTIIFRSCEKPQHDNEAVEIKMEYPETDFDTIRVTMLVSRGSMAYSDSNYVEYNEHTGAWAMAGREVLKSGIHYKYIGIRRNELPNNITVWQSKPVK